MANSFLKNVVVGLRSNAKRAVAFLAGSAMAQGLSAVSGLLLAQWMDVTSYAQLTIFVTLVAATMVITKGGTNIGVISMLGHSWPDPVRASQIVRAGMEARRIVSLLTLPVLVVTSLWMLNENGAPLLVSLLVTSLLIGAWWGDMQTRLLDQVLFFAKQTTRIQLLDGALAVARLAAILLLHLTHTLSVAAAAFVTALPFILRVPVIRRWALAILPRESHVPLSSDVKGVRSAIRRQFPVDFYTVLQMPLILFILSLTGTTSEVAGFGALSRIGQLLVPVNLFSVAFCSPIYAQARTHLSGRLFSLVALLLLPGLALVAVAALFPSALLMLIGPNYASLTDSVVLATIVATATSGANALRILTANRGWVRLNWLQIPFGILWAALASTYLPIGSLNGALLLQLGFAVGVALIALVDFHLAMRSIPPAQLPERHGND